MSCGNRHGVLCWKMRKGVLATLWAPAFMPISWACLVFGFNMKKPHCNHPTPCSNIHTSALTSGRCGPPPSIDDNNCKVTSGIRTCMGDGHKTSSIDLVRCGGSGALHTSCNSPNYPDSSGSPSYVAKLCRALFACNRLADALLR